MKYGVGESLGTKLVSVGGNVKNLVYMKFHSVLQSVKSSTI